MAVRFQRARKPEEKELRRQAILAAARRLMSEVGSVAFSLNELGRRARVSKPNIYRYFESREAVLLEVWVEEVRELTDRLARAFGKLRKNDLRSAIDALTKAFVAQPAMGELTSICTTILERNLSAAAVVDNKRALLGLASELGQILHAGLPAIALADCDWAAATIALYVAGLWPAAHPPPNMEEVYAQPELAALRPRFARDLKRFLEVLFAGLQRAPTEPAKR